MNWEKFWSEVKFSDSVGVIVLGIIGLSISFFFFSLGWAVLN